MVARAIHIFVHLTCQRNSNQYYYEVKTAITMKLLLSQTKQPFPELDHIASGECHCGLALTCALTIVSSDSSEQLLPSRLPALNPLGNHSSYFLSDSLEEEVALPSRPLFNVLRDLFHKFVFLIFNFSYSKSK
jgi:hypothetical protein